MEQEKIRSEAERLIDNLDERKVSFQTIYFWYLLLVTGVGLLGELDAGSYFGFSNQWFPLLFEAGLFVFGLFIMFSGVSVFMKNKSLRFVIFNYTRAGPLKQTFVVAFSFLSIGMLFNFYINPTFGSLGLLLLTLGLLIEIPITSQYNYLLENVYGGDQEEVVDRVVENLTSEPRYS